MQADGEIPVGGPRDDHLLNEEKVVDGIKNSYSTAPSYRHHRSAHLSRKHITVCDGHKPGTIYDRLEFGRHRRKIGGRGQDDPISLVHLAYALVDEVTRHIAHSIQVLETFETGDAPFDFLAGEVDLLCSDPFLFQLIENFLDQDRRVPLFTGASINGHDLHQTLLFGKMLIG